MKRLAWIPLLLLVLPLAGHAQKPKASRAMAAPVSSATRVEGLSSERLMRIGPAMKELVGQGKFPGISVTVARNGRVAYQQEFGYADIEKKAPLKADTIYRIYSMTKPVTGVAVMILFEEGRFVLDDPVSKYIPSFKEMQVFDGEAAGSVKLVKPDREVTIRDLLRQTSGLTYGGADAVGRIYQQKALFDPSTTLEEMAAKMSSIPLKFQPGSRWEYGVSIDILGRLVEVVSGQALDAFMQKRIFDPLKMVDTGFYVPEEKLARFATCYNYTAAKGLAPLPRPAGVDRYLRAKNKMLSGGGGLVSTASDYLRFATMLVRGGELDGARILSPRSVRLMSMDQLPDGVKPASWGGKNDGNGYGFTMSVTTDVAHTTGLGSVGDFGWDGAASTFFRVDPKEKLVVLVMTQRQPCDLEIQVKAKTLAYQAIVE